MTAAKIAAGTITATQIKSGTITGTQIAASTLTTGKLLLTGMLKIYDSTSQNAYAQLGYGQGNDGVETTYGAKLQSGSNYFIVTTAGARITAGKSFYVISTGAYSTGALYAQSTLTVSSTATFNGSIYANGSLVSCNVYPSATTTYSLGSSSRIYNYIYATEHRTSSDRNVKKEISYDLTKFDGLLDRLKPASFRYRKGRTDERQRVGLIAQDLQAALVEHGIDPDDFAPISCEDGKYSIDYQGLIGLIIHEIQTLKKEVYNK